MTITLEIANNTHADSIARVMKQVWPDEETNPAQIAQALTHPDHITHIALNTAGQVVGFVDGFLTTTHNGEHRWEIDLLAVAPAYQGQKIGQQLIAAAGESARQHDIGLLRALIQTENSASQAAFQRCGYSKESVNHLLLVSGATAHQDQDSPHNTHLIPVTTLRYNGLWLEGEITAGGLAAAQTQRSSLRLDIAGVLLPAHAGDLRTTAESYGYTVVSTFNWWQHPKT